MSTRKRGFIEIVGDILNALNKNSLKKSHIASNCNLDLRSLTIQIDLVPNPQYPLSNNVQKVQRVEVSICGEIPQGGNE